MSVRVCQEEIRRIFELHDSVEYGETLHQSACHFLALGWDIVALSAGGDLYAEIDFHGPERIWSRQLVDWALEGKEINLGVRTGKGSRLLVMELPTQEGVFLSYLSGGGSSTCVAETGLGRRLYFYSITDDWQPPASFLVLSFQLMVYGEGGLVLLPPSPDPDTQVSLRWLSPPWEAPPCRLSEEMKQYLSLIACGTKITGHPAGPDITPWRTVYPFVASSPEILAALYTPSESEQAYYQNLLKTALAVGRQDPQVLLSLMWYAPLGNARDHPQGRQFLTELVSSMVQPAVPNGDQKVVKTLKRDRHFGQGATACAP